MVQDYDFGFRKYNPKEPPIMHQPDTLIQNVYDPQSLNRYAFERNNPYRYTDPTGHQYKEAATAVWEWVLFHGPEIINFILNKVRRDSALKIAEKLNELEKEETETTVGEPTVEQKSKTKCYFGPCTYNNIGYNIPQTLNAPTIRNQQSRANSANSPNTNSIPSSTGYGPNTAGNIPGQGYYTSDGRYYPTKNKDFVPGTGNKPSSPGKETGCKLNCAKLLNSPAPKKSVK